MKTKENSPANGANLRKYSPHSVFSVSFDPLAPARLAFRANLRLLHLAFPKCSIVVNSLPLRASAPPRETSPLRSQVSAFRFQASAFTLLEVLVATAVLALMMTFLFNLLGSSAKLWETGNKKIEAAQAARVGLNIIASDLQNAFAGKLVSYNSNGIPFYNTAPFLGIDSSDSSKNSTLNASLKPAEGSDKLFGILLTNNSSNAFDQFDYQCVFVDDNDGYLNMRAYRYFLVSQTRNDDFYFSSNNSTTPLSWPGATAGTPSPIIDNCIRLTFRYYGNQTLLSEQTSSNGTRSFTSNGSWTTANTTTAHPPLGVLVTITVLDSITAEKIAQLNASLNDNKPLSEDDITSGINAALGLDNATTSNDIQRLISQGSETMSRFIPFNSQ